MDALKAILDNHKKWLDSDRKTGERANLSGANLYGADLREADLREADLYEADLRWANLSEADLRGAYLREADLRGAYLREADLRGANLRGANLRGADLDYSCWPLWCGSNHVKVDARIAAQLAAHFCALDCDDPAYLAAHEAVLEFAKTSHRAKVLGMK